VNFFFMACAFFNWCVRVLLDGSAQVCYGGDSSGDMRAERIRENVL